MKEISGEQLKRSIARREELTIVFVHTPLCGTCKLARNMLELVEESLHGLPLVSININEAPWFAQEWKIESVPCLLVFQKGLGVERVYAFRSLPYLHTLLKKYISYTNTLQ
ncbi:thioredoxin family protein [Alkalihalobacillus oceani]|uniref:thioredoxin family protein n=1 Tax=Halalkalibacter oceani TaxID=1653776 RepID=UPI00203AD1B4|nr:thioredoxin family protein [Halalkalibacter oceani]